MLETVEKELTSILEWIIRGLYLVLAVTVASVCIYVGLFPGTTQEQMRYRGINGIGGLALMASVPIAVPVLLYVLWKRVSNGRFPVFWGIALLIAVFPWIQMFLFGIVFHR